MPFSHSKLPSLRSNTAVPAFRNLNRSPGQIRGSQGRLEEGVQAVDEAVTALTIDCTALEYISSAGLRQIVAAHKKMDGALTLTHVSEEVMGIIKMTGLGKKLHIEA